MFGGEDKLKVEPHESNRKKQRKFFRRQGEPWELMMGGFAREKGCFLISASRAFPVQGQYRTIRKFKVKLSLLGKNRSAVSLSYSWTVSSYQNIMTWLSGYYAGHHVGSLTTVTSSQLGFVK